MTRASPSHTDYSRVRGGYFRLRSLVQHRRTSEAHEVLEQLAPLVSSVSAPSTSAGARLRNSFQMQRAVLLMRTGAYELGREVLLQLTDALQEGDTFDPYRDRLLDVACIYLGRVGEHERAVELTEGLVERAVSERQAVLRQTNLGLRLTTLGLERQAVAEVASELGAFQQAASAFGRAEEILADAHKRRQQLALDNPDHGHAVLITRSALCRARIHRAALYRDGDALETLLDATVTLVRDSRTDYTTPFEYVDRAGGVGLAQLQLARLLDEASRRRLELATRASFLLQGQLLQIYGEDSDVPAAVLNYGDALTLCRRYDDAHRVFSVGAQILEARCRRGYAIARLLHRRVAELPH